MVKYYGLANLLKVISSDKIVFCDIKQGNIGADDLREAFKSHHFKEVWIAGYTFTYLSRVKPKLGSAFKYVYNFGFLSFRRGLRKSVELGLDYVQLFGWHCTDKKIQQIKAAGLDYAVCWFGLFFRRFYEAVAYKKGAVFVYYNDLSRAKGNK